MTACQDCYEIKGIACIQGLVQVSYGFWAQLLPNGFVQTLPCSLNRCPGTSGILSISLPGTVVTAAVAAKVDYNTISRSPEAMNTFKVNFVSDMSKALSVSQERVKISSVTAGSSFKKLLASASKVDFTVADCYPCTGSQNSLAQLTTGAGALSSPKALSSTLAKTNGSLPIDASSVGAIGEQVSDMSIDQCASEHVDELCGKCAVNYVDVNGRCITCTKNSLELILFIFWLSCGFTAVLYYFESREGNKGEMTVIYYYTQIAILIAGDLPPWCSFLGFFSLSTLTVMNYFDYCAFHVGEIEQNLLMPTISMGFLFMASLLLASMVWILWKLNVLKSKFRMSTLYRCWIAISLNNYTDITWAAFSVFNCIEVQGKSMLVLFPAIECNGERYIFAKTAQTVLMIVFVVGIPALLFYVWYKSHNTTNKVVDTNDRFLALFGFLFLPYRPGASYYQSVVLLRRTLYGIFDITFATDTQMRGASFMILGLLFLTLNLKIKPYEKRDFNAMEAGGLCLHVILSAIRIPYARPLAPGIINLVICFVVIPFFIFIAYDVLVHFIPLFRRHFPALAESIFGAPGQREEETASLEKEKKKMQKLERQARKDQRELRRAERQKQKELEIASSADAAAGEARFKIEQTAAEPADVAVSTTGDDGSVVDVHGGYETDEPSNNRQTDEPSRNNVHNGEGSADAGDVEEAIRYVIASRLGKKDDANQEAPEMERRVMHINLSTIHKLGHKGKTDENGAKQEIVDRAPGSSWWV
jgi:hypothetical protein